MELSAPVPPGEARERIERAAALPPSRRGRRHRSRAEGDVLRVGLQGALPFLDDRPQAYVRVVEDGAGSRVTGVVKPAYAARVTAVWLVLLLPAALVNAGGATRRALDEWTFVAASRALLALVIAYTYVELLVANRLGKRALRDWLAEALAR